MRSCIIINDVIPEKKIKNTHTTIRQTSVSDCKIVGLLLILLVKTNMKWYVVQLYPRTGILLLRHSDAALRETKTKTNKVYRLNDSSETGLTAWAAELLRTYCRSCQGNIVVCDKE